MRTFLCLLSAILPLAAAETAAKAELRQAIFAYEPTYFALDPGIGNGRPLNAKFQLSIAFRVMDHASTVDPGPLRPDGLYGAFSQTSFWDLGSESKPFVDTSYRPEAWWHWGLPGGAFADHLALEPGIGHESNGKSEPDSRSINHLFIRTQGAWDVDAWTVIAEPRFRTYIEKSDNDDIQRYRGYADLDLSLTRTDSWGLSLVGRIGSQVDRGSLLVELTHPIAPLTRRWLNGFLYLQGFFGWSESLVGYDERTRQPRVLIGFAITR